MIETIAIVVITVVLIISVLAIAHHHKEKVRPDTPDEIEDMEYWKSVSKHKL